jgi:hypothetical protein
MVWARTVEAAHAHSYQYAATCLWSNAQRRTTEFRWGLSASATLQPLNAHAIELPPAYGRRGPGLSRLRSAKANHHTPSQRAKKAASMKQSIRCSIFEAQPTATKLGFELAARSLHASGHAAPLAHARTHSICKRTTLYGEKSLTTPTRALRVYGLRIMPSIYAPVEVL